MSSSARPRRSLQIAQQVEDLRLDRDVERRRRLVGDDERGSQASAMRDQRALPQPAGELVRVVAHAPLRLGHAAPRRSSSIARCRAVAARRPPVDAQRLLDLVADREDRVERRHRLLEDRGRSPRRGRAASRARRASSRSRPLKTIRPAGDPARRLHEPHDRQRRHRLAAARLADEASVSPARDAES